MFPDEAEFPDEADEPCELPRWATPLSTLFQRADAKYLHNRFLWLSSAMWMFGFLAAGVSFLLYGR